MININLFYLTNIILSFNDNNEKYTHLINCRPNIYIYIIILL